MDLENGTNKIDIRQLTEYSLSDIMKIVKDVIIKMNQNGIYQWDEIYPDENTIRKDLHDKCAFGYFINNQLSGYVAINDDIPIEYNSVKWNNDFGKVLIIHRLIVKVQEQGKGISKIMMNFIEKFAKISEFQSIRLDAFSNNPISLNLYESYGYTNVGFVNFRKGLFYCFEKEL